MALRRYGSASAIECPSPFVCAEATLPPAALAAIVERPGFDTERALTSLGHYWTDIVKEAGELHDCVLESARSLHGTGALDNATVASVGQVLVGMHTRFTQHMSVFDALGKAAPNCTVPYKTLYERVFGGALRVYEDTYEGGKPPTAYLKALDDERASYEQVGAVQGILACNMQAKLAARGVHTAHELCTFRQPPKVVRRCPQSMAP